MIINVQEVIDLLQNIPDKTLPCFAFCDGNDNTYRFQKGDRGIERGSYEIDDSCKIDAVYLLVLRCDNEPN